MPVLKEEEELGARPSCSHAHMRVSRPQAMVVVAQQRHSSTHKQPSRARCCATQQRMVVLAGHASACTLASTRTTACSTHRGRTTLVLARVHAGTHARNCTHRSRHWPLLLSISRMHCLPSASSLLFIGRQRTTTFTASGFAMAPAAGTCQAYLRCPPRSQPRALALPVRVGGGSHPRPPLPRGLPPGVPHACLRDRGELKELSLFRCAM